MGILFRYIIKENLKYFGIILTVISIMYLTADFFEKIDNFMAKDVPISETLFYFLLKVPFIVAQVFPLGILLSVLIVFGLMKRNNEIIAITSSGMSIYRLLIPVFTMGVIGSFILFILAEIIVPDTVDRANKIWLVKVQNQKAVLSQEKSIWKKGDHSIIHINHFDRQKKTIYKITLFYFDDNFKLVRRVDALSGEFKKDKWVLSNVIDQWFSGKAESDVFQLDSKVENIGLLPEDISQVMKKSEEMSFWELLAFIRKIEQDGYDATSYRVDLHSKLAFPLVCTIMALLGTGIAIRNKKHDSLPVIIACGIGCAFLYWIVHSFSLSLGYGELLLPWVAAWVANFLFFSLGFFILYTAK